MYFHLTQVVELLTNRVESGMTIPIQVEIRSSGASLSFGFQPQVIEFQPTSMKAYDVRLSTAGEDVNLVM